MSEEQTRSLVAFLRGPVLRCRTAILLLPSGQSGQEPDIAARLGLDAIDYRETLLVSLLKGTEFIAISAGTEFERLDKLASHPGGADCILIYNLDLALSRLDTEERQHLWWNLRDFFAYRPRALILAMPAEAIHLLPTESSLEGWRGANRLAEWAATQEE